MTRLISVNYIATSLSARQPVQNMVLIHQLFQAQAEQVIQALDSCFFGFMNSPEIRG